MTNLAGCAAKNFRASSLYGRRRRRRLAEATDVPIYEFGEINLYYSTSCPKKGDTSKYINDSSLSSCVKNRMMACNNFVNSSSTLAEWNPSKIPFSQSIVDENGYYQTINVIRLSAIPFSRASSVASFLSLPNDIIIKICKCLLISIFYINKINYRL